MTAGSTSISVVICSKGRPDVLAETVDSVVRQTLRPKQIVIVVPAAEDLPRRKPWAYDVQYVVGPHGLTRQRNAGAEAVPDAVTYVGYFDDDFELKADYLERAVAFMDANPNVMGISGHLLANGGITRQQSKELIAGCKLDEGFKGTFFCRGKHHILYGCNMVIRRAALKYEPFDENLPLYAYGEDYDISIRLERYGLIGRFDRCIGVHLETPGGRVREVLRGYALVANNWYFLKKGVMHLPVNLAWTRFWLICVGKCILISLWNLLNDNRSLDWNERLKGNLLALRDILAGRCHPHRIKEI